VSRSPTSEGRERQHFLMEMDKALKDRDQDIVIVSSSGRDEPAVAEGEDDTAVTSDYPWVARRLRQYVVGKTGPAVQHAKLWLLHWGSSGPDEPEHLEIVISSANLTRSAFRQQLQGAWRVCLPLTKSPSAARLGAWQVLPAFLDALAQSAGIADGLQAYRDLLARAECPDDVTLVASVPGSHDRSTLRRTPWGSAGLAQLAPTGSAPLTVTVLCPFVGGWNVANLTAWATDAGVETRRVQLVWIDSEHPWAREQRWTLPDATLRTLRQAKAQLLQLPTHGGANATLHTEHRGDDGRWSHIKAYRFQRRRGCTMLLTSANFSPSAWGYRTHSAALHIKNFELGVAIRSSSWPLADLPTFIEKDGVHTTEATSALTESLISWGQATWNGAHIAIECRCTHATPVTATVRGASEPITCALPGGEPNSSPLRAATVVWAAPTFPPTSVSFDVDGVVHLTVPVLDGREPAARDDDIPDGVDQELAEEIRIALLFEQYGGAYLSDAEDDVDEDSEAGDEIDALTGTDAPGRSEDEVDGDVTPEAEIAGAASGVGYGVPSIEQAREYWRIVDKWGGLIASASDEHEHRRLLADGPRLREAFTVRATADRRRLRDDRAIGAELAAEELSLRLRLLETRNHRETTSRRGGQRA